MGAQLGEATYGVRYWRGSDRIVLVVGAVGGLPDVNGCVFVGGITIRLNLGAHIATDRRPGKDTRFSEAANHVASRTMQTSRPGNTNPVAFAADVDVTVGFLYESNCRRKSVDGRGRGRCVDGEI